MRLTIRSTAGRRGSWRCTRSGARRLGPLAAAVRDRVQGPGTLTGEIGQCPPSDVLHRNEAERCAVVLDFIDLIDHRDIGMGESRAGARLREQLTRRLLWVASRANDFQRDRPAQTLVLGPIYITHRTRTEVGDQVIAR